MSPSNLTCQLILGTEYRAVNDLPVRTGRLFGLFHILSTFMIRNDFISAQIYIIHSLGL